eukprot:PhF_6_TR13930/c0_g1_i2/m.22400
MVLTRTEPHWIQKNIMNDDVLVYMWWQVLCGISTVNIILWLYTALTKSFASNHNKGNNSTKTPRLMLLLSGLFVAGCAFRSFFVKDYFRLLVLREHPLSSVFAGRSIAMVAEVSFASQFAILLYNYGRQAGVRWITAFAKYGVVGTALSHTTFWGQPLRNHCGPLRLPLLVLRCCSLRCVQVGCFYLGLRLRLVCMSPLW